MAIQSAEEAKRYLRAKGVEFKDVVELKGGTANYVFRVTKSPGDTVVLKHAEPHIRSNPSRAFPVERMNFEAAALRTINGRLPEDDTVNAAELFSYDEDEHVLLMSDGGDQDLKAAYPDPSLDVGDRAYRIGQWLANLHSATKTTDIGNNVIAKAIYRHSYRNLANALEKYGFEKKLGERVDSEFGSLLTTDDECVCHGDFWPGNVLVSPTHKLTIVDWEMTRRGTGATDVGQFTAESWLLDRFEGGKKMVQSFLNGYVEAVGGKDKLSEQWKKRVVLHCGTHLAFWPTVVEWGTREETGEVVSMGREMILRAMDEDWKWLRQSDFAPLI